MPTYTTPTSITEVLHLVTYVHATVLKVKAMGYKGTYIKLSLTMLVSVT